LQDTLCQITVPTTLRNQTHCAAKISGLSEKLT